MLPLPLGQQRCVVPKLHGKVSVVVISTVCSSVVCRIRKAETTVALLQPGCFREGFLQWKAHWRFKMIAAFEAQPISAALLFSSRDLINAGSLKLQELLAFRSQLAAPSVKEDLCVWQEGRWAACNQDRQSSSVKVLSLSRLISYPCWRVETCLCFALRSSSSAESELPRPPALPPSSPARNAGDNQSKDCWLLEAEALNIEEEER